MISNIDLINTVILNISTTEDLSYLSSLRELLKKTEYFNFVDLLDIIEKYYNDYKKLPSKEYIQNNIITLEENVVIPEYFPEYNFELLGRLKKDIISQELREALNKPQNFETFYKLRDTIIQNSPTQETYVTFDDTDLQSSLEKEYEKTLKRATGVLTNTPLDLKSRGLPFGATTAIGAQPGAGKTSFALSIAYSAVVNQKLKGIYISLEIAKKTIYQRLLSRFLYDKGYEIDNLDIIKSTLTDKKKKIYMDNIKPFQDIFRNHLKVVTQEDLPEFNKAGLETFFRDWDNKFDGIDFVILDQVSLLKYFEPLNGKGSAKDEYAIINQYIRYLTILSYEGFFKKPVAMILLCQIKREAFSKIIKRKALDLSVFAEASELERSANQAYVLRYVDELKMSGLIELTLIKNRDGESSLEYTPAVFLPQYCLLGTPDVDDSASSIQDLLDTMDTNIEDLT